ncbi:cytochrome b5 domain-containing protein [Candidatus Roizmanbacteria bacterium]|nr:MAG: cytochrome b5 domain-containing protein [Candidatus Roizmanbacteria bacterium]
MNKNTIIILTIVVLVILGGVVFLTPKNQQSNIKTQTQQTETTNQATSSDQIQNEYSIADVRAHGTESSCWSAVNGKVYDLTNWINQHPGGPEKITQICGIDGSQGFNGQHGGQSEPESMLKEFYIGNLQGS